MYVGEGGRVGDWRWDVDVGRAGLGVGVAHSPLRGQLNTTIYIYHDIYSHILHSFTAQIPQP